MCTTYRVVHSGLKELSTILKSSEHTFFCRIERLFEAWLCRQKRPKTAQKKLSTKNILYYYNYYFHVPIKKGLRVGYTRARTRTSRPLLCQYTQCRLVAIQEPPLRCRFGTLGANCIREERNGWKNVGFSSDFCELTNPWFCVILSP